MIKVLRLTLIPCLLTALVACGEKNPDEQGGTDSEGAKDGTDGTDSDGDTKDGGDDSDTADTDTGLPLAEDYYPMAVGLVWVYEESLNGVLVGTNTYEITDRQSMSFDIVEGVDIGVRDVLFFESNRTYNDEWTIQYIEDGRDFATRWMHDVYEVDFFTKRRLYTTGFLRFDRVRMLEPGNEFTETIERYQNIDPANDPSIFTGPVGLDYRYTVKEVGASKAVRGVTYADCVNLERYNRDDNAGVIETKDYWFCKGIGKVMETSTHSVDGVKVEELVSCTLCDK